MSKLYPDMLRLYDGGNGPLTKAGLKKAVEKPKEWITPDEYATITGEAYVA